MSVRDSLLGKLLGDAETFSGEQVLQTITLLVENGAKRRATDIHIEPHERFVLVRYRIDGVLFGIYKLPSAALPFLMQQLKKLAHLNDNAALIPQEGQYTMLVGSDQLEIHVSVLPVLGGEKAVLHISRQLTSPPSLKDLGFWGISLHELSDNLALSHGLVVVAAPRQSGKTTTLHSLLRMINTPSVSVATVENSIEYRLPGANQTHVKPHHGITFHDGLQAVLSQDPNIVMVGSLPDGKTADLAVQAAASGHILFAGMYADSAIGALVHLKGMASELFLLTTELKVIIGQRLVRQLCEHCRESYTLSREEAAEIKRSFGITSAQAQRKLHELEKQAASEAVGNNNPLNTTPLEIVGLWRTSENGCDHCERTGYTGSIAIDEVLVNDAGLQKLLLGNMSLDTLHNQALKSGFIPMGLDGLIKALRGLTTVTEILRTL